MQARQAAEVLQPVVRDSCLNQPEAFEVCFSNVRKTAIGDGRRLSIDHSQARQTGECSQASVVFWLAGWKIDPDYRGEQILAQQVCDGCRHPRLCVAGDLIVE